MLAVMALMGVAAGGMAVAAAASAEPTDPLVQAAGCAEPMPPAPPEPAPAMVSGGGAAVPVVLFIPPTVFVRVDDGGAPTALMTNTGCAPRPSDRVLVEIDANHAIAASPALIETVMALSFDGDWRESGRWHET